LHSSVGVSLFTLILFPAFAAPSPTAAAVDFDREVRPILSDTCFACHGPDEKQRMAKLRLDTREGLFAERKTYSIVVPGDAAKSRLYQKITADAKAGRMPPPTSGLSLNAKQIETIKKWIDQGAKWEMHWSYVPPRRPEPPEVKNPAWARNPIDRFVLARLEREGLSPSPEADRVTLLRRVTLDLTGLPPTPDEVRSFLADRSPNAYEKWVDALLSSPHYGERMAMQWLDLARYADTHGYHIDSHREMWHWRDWVINAFNKNMPFDRFTIEQLAGDLLPNATLEQKIATGFNRNHMINFEGGAIPEEYRVEYVSDRVDTTATVWMGMTLGCARCHDHKYDPIKQKDYYRFSAFFNQIPEKGLDGRKGNAEPVVLIPSPHQQERLDAVARLVPEKEKALDAPQVKDLFATWQASRLASFPPEPRDGLEAHYELNGNFADISGHYHHGRTVTGDVSYVAGPAGKAAEFDGETEIALDGIADFDRDKPFSLATWIRLSGTHRMAVLAKLSPAEDGRRGFELISDEAHPLPRLHRGSALIFRMTHKWPDNAIEIRTREPLVQDRWYHLVLGYDGSGKAKGLTLYVDGKLWPVETERDALSGSCRTAEPLEIGRKGRGEPPYRGRLADLRIYSGALAPEQVNYLAEQHPVRVILSGTAGKRTKDQDARLRDYYLTFDAPPELRQTYAELKALKQEKEDLDWTVPSSMVMQTAEKPRDTFVLIRGDYQNHGEKVTAGVPSALPPLPKDAPANRLTLARWLVSPANPLTARVTVNRYWQMYFGTGLVKSSEDFGSQGEPPSNPELLDWLATEFIRTGWDIKAMQRLIVTSATYRQSSRVTPALVEKDPENRLLARGPRFRLPAEVVRDNALAVSGLLDERIGGPSVFPYQPRGLWEEMAYGDVYSAQSYTPSHGADLYRRSMYTFWKRTVPPPSLSTFDAPDREKCTARRTLTNTPLQALVLLNDPTYVEAARVLATKTLSESGKNTAKRIEFAFRLATARRPEPKEARVLKELAAQELRHYRQDRQAALKLLAVGEKPRDPKLDPAELAAWTTVTSTILNLDEVITKE